MSAAIRPKRQNPPVSPPAAPAAELLNRARREPEAPEQGYREREAPEMMRRGRSTSFPEAGEGRAGLLEREFTHGRSQS
ncbi:MAG TPA: hypothetical protein VKP69_03400 [Isosphaeraceae bacterium]|nr:hypothetical protein [Isosphaeraceae bacterium]